jgi:hypothetical protein
VRARRSRSGGWLAVLAAGLVALLAYRVTTLAYGSVPAASYQGETATGVDPPFCSSARGLLGWLLDRSVACCGGRRCTCWPRRTRAARAG